MRILVVEDEQRMAEILTQAAAIAVPSADIEWTTTLRSALQLIQRSRYRVILLDLLLADSAGLETLDAIDRAVGLERVLVVSGQADLQPKVEGRARWVGKPFSTLALVAAIRAAAAPRPSAEYLLGLLESSVADLASCVRRKDGAIYGH